MKNQLAASGKYYRGIKINGVKHDVHRHIVETMLGRTLKSNEVVHHINGNKQDNNPDNLKVMTRAEHTQLHSSGRKASEETKRKLSDMRMGKPNTCCRKLSDNDVLKILDCIKQGISQRQIGIMFGVEHTAITNINTHKTYKNVSDKLTSPQN